MSKPKLSEEERRSQIAALRREIHAIYRSARANNTVFTAREYARLERLSEDIIKLSD